MCVFVAEGGDSFDAFPEEPVPTDTAGFDAFPAEPVPTDTDGFDAFPEEVGTGTANNNSDAGDGFDAFPSDAEGEGTGEAWAEF